MTEKTVTLVVPEGYANGEEFAKDCGFEIAKTDPLTDAGWKEATIAWSVCASLHREYCKGRDPFFKTRQADFMNHEDGARARIIR